MLLKRIVLYNIPNMYLCFTVHQIRAVFWTQSDIWLSFVCKNASTDKKKNFQDTFKKPKT